MKTSSIYYVFCRALAVGFILLGIISCKKDDSVTPSPPVTNYTYNFPPETFSVITREQLDAFRNAKMPIYEGANPPQIFDYSRNSTVLILTKVSFSVDHTCIFDNKAPSNQGVKYDSFTNSIQIYTDSNKNVVTYVDYTSALDKGSGSGFASGSGDNFSAFFKVEKGVVNGVSYQALWVISGTVTRNANKEITGINKLHACFLILNKGNDPQDKVANKGTIRVFKDPDEKSDRVF